MKTAIKIFLGFVAVLFAFVPLIFGSTYVFSGFSKEAAIKALEVIPASRFWMFGISLFLLSFYGVFNLLWSFLRMGHPEVHAKIKVPRKQVYRLEDDNISEQLKNIDLSRDTIIADVAKFLTPDICNCDGRDMPTYLEDGKRWCPQCGYEVK